MTTINPTVSMCRHCQHYLVEGRRGGQCKQLGAPVQGRWKSCQLAIPAFAPSWEGVSGSQLWREQTTHIEPGIIEPGIIPSYTLEALEACIQSDCSAIDASSTHEPISISSSASKCSLNAC